MVPHLSCPNAPAFMPCKNCASIDKLNFYDKISMVSRTGAEPNCPTTMHFRIFRRAFARKMVITEESQIIRPATSNFCVLCRNSPCKMRILLRLASTKSIKNCNAGGCFAVLSEQILCRCKEKMRSNISYCENFICSKCGYLSLKTVWI